MVEGAQAELMPCPFCGGEAQLVGQLAPEMWVGCMTIGCMASTEAFGSAENAIAVWNRRHRSEAVKPPEEALALAQFPAEPAERKSDRKAP